LREGAAIGLVGLKRYAELGELELSWYIWDAEAEGKGYAAEAAKAVLAAACEAGLPPLVSFIAPSNARSVALAKRLGATEEPGEIGIDWLAQHRIWRHASRPPMPAFHERAATGPSADRAAAMQALVPMIETERLVLRAPRIEDFQAFAQILASPQGKTYGNPTSRDEAWFGFMQLTATWYLRGHGAWVITLRETGAVIGISQISPEPGDEEYELGWLLDAAHEGQGYATEAAAAIRDFAVTGMQLPSLVSYIYRSNSKSQAVAQRLGAVQDTHADWPHKDTLIYRHHPGRDKAGAAP
jgi:RimJ/RimL family protein N-acetyltransferase